MSRTPRKLHANNATEPPVDDRDAWRQLLNHLYLYEEDALFRWATLVKSAVCGEDDKAPNSPRGGA